MVGANDSCLPVTKHHVPLERFKENISYMVKKIFSVAAARGEERVPKVLLIAPPPIDLDMLKVHHRLKGTDRDLKVIREYAEAVLEVGRDLVEENVTTLDFHRLLFSEANRDDSAAPDTPVDLKAYLTDGLHLGPKAGRAKMESAGGIG